LLLEVPSAVATKIIKSVRNQLTPIFSYVYTQKHNKYRTSMMGQLKKFLKDNPSITGTNIIKLAFIGMMLAIIPTSFVAVQSFKFVRPQAAYDTSPPAPPTVTPTPGPGYKLTVTSPKGGETWSLGKANTITWTFDAQNQPFIPYPVDTTITLTKVAADGSMRNQYTIADRTAKTNIGANSYTWNIPTAGIETGTYRVLIQLWKLYQAPGGGAAYPYGVSAADFTIGINVPPSYTTQLRSPNGGEHFFTGHVYTAKWNFQAANAPAVIYPINTTIALQQGDNTKGWRDTDWRQYI
jgi:hypothetical protein